jgi:hypothetical protein
MDETATPGWGRSLGAALAGLFLSWLVATGISLLAFGIALAVLSGVTFEGDDGLGVFALGVMAGVVLFAVGYVVAGGFLVPVFTRSIAKRQLSFGAGVVAVLAGCLGPVLGMFTQDEWSETLAVLLALAELVVSIALPTWIIRTLAKPLDVPARPAA